MANDFGLFFTRDSTPGTVQVKQTGSDAPVASPEPVRSVPRSELAVGSLCVVNGPYFASSYGDTPSRNGGGRRVRVSRIVDAERDYPVHIESESGEALGWTKRESLQAVSL